MPRYFLRSQASPYFLRSYTKNHNLNKTRASSRRQPSTPTRKNRKSTSRTTQITSTDDVHKIMITSEMENEYASNSNKLQENVNTDSQYFFADDDYVPTVEEVLNN